MCVRTGNLYAQVPISSVGNVLYSIMTCFVSDDVITNGVIAELREEINSLKQKVNKLESKFCQILIKSYSTGGGGGL